MKVKKSINIFVVKGEKQNNTCTLYLAFYEKFTSNETFKDNCNWITRISQIHVSMFDNSSDLIQWIDAKQRRLMTIKNGKKQELTFKKHREIC